MMIVRWGEFKLAESSVAYSIDRSSREEQNLCLTCPQADESGLPACADRSLRAAFRLGGNLLRDDDWRSKAEAKSQELKEDKQEDTTGSNTTRTVTSSLLWIIKWPSVEMQALSTACGYSLRRTTSPRP